jgi:hypothetical protein
MQCYFMFNLFYQWAITEKLIIVEHTDEIQGQIYYRISLPDTGVFHFLPGYAHPFTNFLLVNKIYFREFETMIKEYELLPSSSNVTITVYSDIKELTQPIPKMD